MYRVKIIMEFVMCTLTVRSNECFYPQKMTQEQTHLQYKIIKYITSLFWKGFSMITSLLILKWKSRRAHAHTLWCDFRPILLSPFIPMPFQCLHVTMKETRQYWARIWAWWMRLERKETCWIHSCKIYS
jgi:hypothetical protein